MVSKNQDRIFVCSSLSNGEVITTSDGHLRHRSSTNVNWDCTSMNFHLNTVVLQASIYAVLLCNRTFGTSVGHPIKTYLYQLCADTRCSQEDLPEAIDKYGWQERVRESVHAAQLNNDDGIKCLGEIYEQFCGLKIFPTNFFDDSIDTQNSIFSPIYLMIPRIQGIYREFVKLRINFSESRIKFSKEFSRLQVGYD